MSLAEILQNLLEGKTYSLAAVLDTNGSSADSIIRNRAGVVVSGLHSVVGLLNSVKNGVRTGALGTVGQRNGPGAGVLLVGQRTRVRSVQVGVGHVNVVVDVVDLVSNEGQQVGTAVPATERGELPVGGERGNHRVVGVESAVGGSLEVVGDGATNQEGVDGVGVGVVVTLVKGEHDKCVLHQVLVLEEVSDEVVRPGTAERDVGVMAVVSHVRGDERVLGETLVVKIIVEAGEVLDLAQTGSVIGHRVEDDEGVVLTHVVVGAALRVTETLVTSVRETFLVLAPGDLAGVEKVSNGRDIVGDLPPGVVVHSEVVTTRSGDVVGLRWVSNAPVVVQEDTVLLQLVQMRLNLSGSQVLGTLALWSAWRIMIPL